MRLRLALSLAAALTACSEGPPEGPSPGRDGPVAAPPPAPEPPPPELRPAPAEGAVAAIVAGELAAARTDGLDLVVVVGAAWCEPCVAFHDALARGQLDAALPGVRFLEFDLDRDRARLEEAGYQSRLIPLFVLPEADGRGGGRRIEGGIKGDGAVEHILRRLRPLIAGAR